MTKSKVWEEAQAICKKFELGEEVLASFEDLLAPKVGGGGTGRVATPEDYTVFDANGEVTHVFCNAHKMWEPVSEFKADEKSKNGFKRECILSTTQYNAWNNQTIASKKAIINDVLDGVITGSEAKAMIDALPKVEYASSGGVAERP